VTAEKRREQLASGKARAAQLGITDAQSCLTCCPASSAARTGGRRPRIRLYRHRLALHALRLRQEDGNPEPLQHLLPGPDGGHGQGLEEGAEFRVESTLWADGECKVSVPRGRMNISDYGSLPNHEARRVFRQSFNITSRYSSFPAT
jgi:hypothetical protein